ncbi:MAG: tetratricopeptide repeat protein [Candidatus Riflebacteria bacterium]|nr:tetratricopeptide repeat protein [Candidatus Riflebacteria bacterium]
MIKRFWLLVTVFLFHALFQASFCLGQDPSAQLFDQGVKLFTAKDYSGAIDYLGQVCDMAPNNAQARYYLIQSLLAMKKNQAASNHLNILLKLDPSNPQYQALTAQIEATPKLPDSKVPQKKPPTEVITGGYDDSTPSSPKVPKAPKIPNNPKPAPPRIRTTVDEAVDAIDSQNYPMATKLLDLLISKEPKNAMAFHYRGVVEKQMGKTAEAIPYFEKALALEPNNFESLFLYGDALLKLGKLEEAEKNFEKAIKIKPGLFAMINLAETKKLLGKKNETIDLYRSVLKIDGNMIEAKLNLADALIDDGKLQEALGHVNDVLADDAKNGMAHYIKAKIMTKNEMFDEAAEQIKLALEANPENEAYTNFYAKALLKAGKTAEALDAANKLIQAHPENDEARMLIAETLIKTGDIANAEDHVAMIEKNGKNPRAMLLRARINRGKGEKEPALEMYKGYLSQAAGDSEVTYEYATLLEEAGNKNDAIDMYRDVIAKFPGTSVAASAEERLTALGPKEAPAMPKGPNQPKPEPGKVKY